MIRVYPEASPMLPTPEDDRRAWYGEPPECRAIARRCVECRGAGGKWGVALDWGGPIRLVAMVDGEMTVRAEVYADWRWERCRCKGPLLEVDETGWNPLDELFLTVFSQP